MATTFVLGAWKFRFHSLYLTIPPLLVGIFGQLVLELFLGGHSIGIGPYWSGTAASYGEAAGIGVGASFSVLLVASIADVAAGLLILFQWAGRKAVTYVVVGAVIYAVTLLSMSLGPQGSHTMIDDLGKDTFCATVGQHLSLLPADHVRKTCYELSLQRNPATEQEADNILLPLRNVIQWGYRVSIMLIVSITMAVVAISALPAVPQVHLAPPDPAKPDDPPRLDKPSADALAEAAHDLAMRMRSLKTLVIAAAIALVAVVAFIKTWTEWPIAFWHLVDPADKVRGPLVNAYVAIESALVGYESLIVVLVMIASFGPLSALLTERARQLSHLDPRMTDDPEERSKWRTSRGVALTTSEQIQRGLLIISPLLAGPAAELATKLVVLFKP